MWFGTGGGAGQTPAGSQMTGSANYEPKGSGSSSSGKSPTSPAGDTILNDQQNSATNTIMTQPQRSPTEAAAAATLVPALHLPQGAAPAATATTTTTNIQQQQQPPLILQSSSSSNSSSSIVNHHQQHHQQQHFNSKSPEPKISFHLKTSIFTRRITIDSDKMALGLIKQLAIAFLNEIYFQHSYPQTSYIGDYLRKHYGTNEQLMQLYDRLILRKYSPEGDTFQPFYSACDIQPDSYISIELSERELPLSGDYSLGTGSGIAQAGGTGALNSTLSSTSSGASAGTGASLGTGTGIGTGASGAFSTSSTSTNLSSLAAAAAHQQQQHQQPATPTAAQLKISHDFHTESYFMPTHCASCAALIKGVFKQGFQCSVCKKNYCPKCKLKAEATGEGCLAALSMMSASSTGCGVGVATPQPSSLLSPSSQMQANCLATTLSSGCDSGHSSTSSSVSPNNGNPTTLTGPLSRLTHGLTGAAGHHHHHQHHLQHQQQQPQPADKLEIMTSGQQHANMSKRKSASNLLHFNIANPFKSHHNNNNNNTSNTQNNQQQQAGAPTDGATGGGGGGKGGFSSGKSLRGSAGALDPILQQLSKQMRDQQQQQQSKLVTSPGGSSAGSSRQQQQRSSISSASRGGTNDANLLGSKLLNVQAAQLSSSHQNLYTISDREREANASNNNNNSPITNYTDSTDATNSSDLLGGGSGSGSGGNGGSSSAHQSPSKLVQHQLSNSARNSARDLASTGCHSPTRRAEQVANHSFVRMQDFWPQQMASGEQQCLCGVCNKPLNGSQSLQQPPVVCKTCKLQVHGQCQNLTSLDCLSRLAESTRAAAAAASSSSAIDDNKTTTTNKSDAQQGGEQGDDKTATHARPLKSTNSNVSRDNIRLHRLAPSVKHVKRPDLTKPIIEGWLQHKTLSDEQSRRHYWRLDETDITLYENDTSTRYFKAIALNKITRVISASSLPKQIKEDVALSGLQSPPNDQQTEHADQSQSQTQTQTNNNTKAKSANTSPLRTTEFKAQMEAMFAFEVNTGSVYLVQARDPNEADRWKGSLEAITAKRAQASNNTCDKALPTTEEVKQLPATGKDAGTGTGIDAVTGTGETKQEENKQVHVFREQPQVQQERRERLEKQQQREAEQEAKQANVLNPSNQQQQQQQLKTDEKQQKAQGGGGGGRHHHHHHHHHHHTPSGGAYRGQHKTYTDPNRSRLYNRPRIVIKLDPMSIPDHWIEGKYLIERNRTKGVGFEELGSGQFGKVYAGISEIKADDSSKGLWSGVPVAIKEISKARFDLRQQAKLKNEANILSRLDHPGVIILERVHDLPDKLYIVMEQLEDDMLEMIVSTEEKRLNERVTKFLTYQILEALKYLHAQNIAHCDLKPENVLLCERRSQFPQIKLCDFGFAKIIEENSFRSSLVGTPAYLAPEVVKGERYNRSVDLWSVGVIVYVSLSGEFPFNEGENIHDQISRANFMYPDQPWAKISQQAKNFINSLLRVNSDRRLSASRAQMDDWIQDFQLWCDLCELELRVGRRWVTDDTDFGRWSRYARQRQLQVPRAAIQLHQECIQDD